MSEARLFRDGRIFTGERYVEALLVEDGRVRSVGTLASVERAAPRGVEVERLSGGLVIPGLVDAHLHLAEVTRTREGLDVSAPGSVDELVLRVRRWGEDHPDGVLVGRGWDAERFSGAQWPLALDLDRALSDRPVVLYHVSGHAAVVNSAALSAAGLDRSTPDPPHGKIGRATDGAPDGRLFEAAMALVGRVVAEASRPDPAGLRRTLVFAASLGLTTVATMSTGPEEAAVLRSLAGSRELPIRVRLYLRLSRLREFSPSSLGPEGRPDRFAVVGTKAFTDGAFGPRTAWLSRPYADRPDEVGLEVGSEPELSTGIERSIGLGLAPALHAIGDRAVERAVRLLAPWAGRTKAPVRIEHAALTPPELWPLLEKVRPALVVQPGFVWSDHWLADRLGGERARWAYAFRSLLARGLLLAGSSDAPYDPIDPWRGLRAAVGRVDPQGRSANPSPNEALDAESAVRLYTVHAGRALGAPALGNLEPAARADLVVLDAPDLPTAVARGAPFVRSTWVDGETVYVRRSGGAGETV